MVVLSSRLLSHYPTFDVVAFGAFGAVALSTAVVFAGCVDVNFRTEPPPALTPVPLAPPAAGTRIRAAG